MQRNIHILYRKMYFICEGKSDLVSISVNSKILLFSIFVTVISDGLYYSICMAYTIHIYTCTIVAHSVYITVNIWSMGCFHFPGKKRFSRVFYTQMCYISHTHPNCVGVMQRVNKTSKLTNDFG